ncbi:MAG: methylenetetrahydrofolate--tRNA-(uracil(54)-C(5))-methyltransferase (FADH(2)-oxidizing) TrmFO [Christensenellales bacterium]|jgi:methylenetetrahydrofolate--tRNA-(uracil-5-)-methyltransferase
MNKRVTIVGAGLAGCEAAWQIAKRGLFVRLIEMKPKRFSPVHRMEGFCELVCSNSLKGTQLTAASGLLKAEMEKMDSLVMRAAQAARVPAGGALAVDRDMFSRFVTDFLSSHPKIEIVRDIATEVPDAPAIVATGPLTDAPLAESIQRMLGEKSLYFFDAAAPIVTKASLDMDKVFAQSRYDKGEGEYLNCPMTEEEYRAFYEAFSSAETAEPHDFEKRLIFEGCIAIEILASRGYMTPVFGPLKPVGLTDPKTGKMPFAVVQLRQDNAEGTLYNLVGFQTRLKFGEQKRVFSMIPGLEKAEFARYGVMHRNTYLHSPRLLGRNYALKGEPLLRFAGQMTGVEGYVESAASGIVAGISLAEHLLGRDEPDFTRRTLMGALEAYVRTENADYQPMNANFGILEPLPERVRGKRFRYEKLAERALETIDTIAQELQERNTP